MNRFLACLGALVVVAASGLPSSSARVDNTPRISKPRPFLKLEPGRRVSTAPNKGQVFHARERRAYEVTTFYANMTAVAARSSDGSIRSEVTYGARSASLAVSPASETGFALSFRRSGELPLLLRGRSDLIPTLDWANRQSVSLLEAADPVRIRWSLDIIAPTTRGDKDALSEIVGVRTQWPEGLVADASRQERYSETKLSKFGTVLGVVRWFPTERVLAWSFPGLTQGALDDESQARIGGWPFTPDMAWMNVQALAFFEYASNRRPVLGRADGLLRSAREFLSPAVLAQDGCTGLHWLDGTTYRECCDIHDMCYEKNGCDRSSWWWPFGNAWQCTACNGGAVFCFTAKQGTPWVY